MDDKSSAIYARLNQLEGDVRLLKHIIGESNKMNSKQFEAVSDRIINVQRTLNGHTLRFVFFAGFVAALTLFYMFARDAGILQGVAGG